MRELVIEKLCQALNDARGDGIPRSFDCEPEDNIFNDADLHEMSDADLLTVFEAHCYQGMV